jgi:hypothetical protein
MLFLKNSRNHFLVIPVAGTQTHSRTLLPSRYNKAYEDIAL